MHVGLNLVFLVPGETGGMETAARETLPALFAAAPPDMRFTAFVSRDAGDGPWRDVETVVVPVSSRRRSEWVRGEQQHLPRLAARSGVDLVHSFASTAPLRGRFVRVVTVHDLIFRHMPEVHGRLGARAMGFLVPQAIRRCRRVIAVSQATRDDIVASLGTPREKIDVVYQGHGLAIAANPVSEIELRSRFELGERRVLLALSAKLPHKNLAVLLDALAGLDERPLLVLAGYPTPHERELRAHAAALGLSEDVRWPGWLSAPELEGFWAITAGFVFPSLYEGFGVPPLEAMSRGVPVACSNTSALPEIVDGAAILFDPRDPDAVAGAIRRLLAGDEEIERLREAGRRRAGEFTWERTAQGLLASYLRALESTPSSR